jgi:choline-sulfatase
MWWLLACSPPEAVAPGPRPDPVRGVLLVTLDTTRRDHLGVYGEPRGLTPALDAFAEDARVFTEARSAAPWTKPSVASMLTNLLPHAHGVTQWEHQLASDQDTLATTLHDAGWTTEGYVAHNALDPRDNRFHLGFDVFETTWRTQPLPGSPDDSETSTWLAQQAVAAFERLAAEPEPFLLWAHFFDPHDTYLPHAPPLGDDPASLYAGEIAWTDQHLAALLAATADHPEVVVVVLADHGEQLGERGRFGHGHVLYDELVHVPVLLRAPGVAPGRDATPVGTVDLAPTVLGIVDVPQPATFPGSSWLTGEPQVVFHEVEREADVRGVTGWPFKLVWDRVAGTTTLFDLQADPGETADATPAHQAEADLLAAELYGVYGP